MKTPKDKLKAFLDKPDKEVRDDDHLERKDISKSEAGELLQEINKQQNERFEKRGK